MNVPPHVVARFLRYQAEVPGGPGDCWLWPKSVGSHGYGQIGWQIDGRTYTVLVHRLAWEVAHKPIPEGLTVDHICRVRRCFNPSHLRLLTNEDNARDNGFATRSHCPAGHAYDDDNTYLDPNGHRRCRQCARDRRAA